MKPILIVDDEAPIRALIRLTLERAGYTCDEAATGTEAADKIEVNTYDLALLDIMLPGPDGYELLDYLRSVQTPVIFLTAKTAVADRVRGLHLGADDYITKPFEPTELVARVEACLLYTSWPGCPVFHRSHPGRADFGHRLQPRRKQLHRRVPAGYSGLGGAVGPLHGGAARLF